MTTTSNTPVTVDALVAAYDRATGAAKAAIRRHVMDEMGNAIRSGDFVVAKIYADAVDAMAPASAEKAPVDYANLIKVRVATYLRAAAIMAGGLTYPDGTPDDFDSKIVNDDVVDALGATWNALVVTLDDDTRADVINKATKLVHDAKINSGTKAPKRDVGAHIAEVTTRHGQGFMTIAEIAKSESDTYGTDRPSPGAVTAHFGSKGYAITNVTFVKKGTRVAGMKADAKVDGAFIA